MSSRLRTLSGSLAGLMLVAAALVAGTLSTPSTTSEQVELSSCIGYCAYPRNAAKVYRWGVENWSYEFEKGPFPRRHWESNHPKLIGQQSGMLTIKAPARAHKIVVWPNDQVARYGRWEARLRAVELNSLGKHFKFTWRLVAAGGARCGGNQVVLSSYRPGDRAVQGVVRTLPDNEFSYSSRRDLRSRAWHAFAIEVTRNHISWFVDTRVVHTERRPAALSGVKLRPQFVIKAGKGLKRKSMMQMDWVRYYTLARPGARSIAAPRMVKGTFGGAC